jgi:uncharacterized membrane protein
MRPPQSPARLLLFVFAVLFVIAFVQVGLITIAFDKLGLSADSAFLLLFASLFGSGINLPLFSIRAEPPDTGNMPDYLQGLMRPPLMRSHGKTVIAVNVGGGLIPIFFSVYLLLHNPLSVLEVVVSIAVVAGIAHLFSRPVAGIGIGMPIFIAPISAAILAVIVDPTHSAPLAYICGTLGVLLGADILRLRDVRKLGTPMAAIGGAGTFDGIFITGIVAVLLA